MQLSNPVTAHFRLTDTHKRALLRLGITTIEDLLRHFPSRYEHGGGGASIADIQSGAHVTLVGRLEKLRIKKSWKRKIPVAEGYLRDDTGRIKVRWFHQPYIAKMYPEGSVVRAVGKVTGSGEKLYLANPELQRVGLAEFGTQPQGNSMIYHTEEKAEESALLPIYPESSGVTSLWFRHAIAKILQSGAIEKIEDALPAGILSTYNLPALRTALLWIHAPKSEKNAIAARKRFAFEEVFFIQLRKLKDRKEFESHPAFVIEPASERIDEFIAQFPFTATAAQKRAVAEILRDFKTGHPMSRLLEGDVGSGKTAVAAATAFAVVTTRPSGQNFGNLQVAYMAPTEILAKQHFDSFIKFFAHMPINIGLITGSGCKKFPSKVNPTQATDISRAQLLKWVANGEIPILLGTHALIQKSVKFKNLAYAVIDEQHRFGTKQRASLIRKDAIAPHLLSMTATPIPRTLALTIYGDLDLSLLDESPEGRKPIMTEIVAPHEREKTYEAMRRDLETGRQAYVICPRIDLPAQAGEPGFNPLAIEAKSVKEEAKRLKKDIFPEYEISILHSKMRPAEKDEVMERFLKNEIKILVATSVVEVGVSVPNATSIIIEGAERFGLSQLHQLRGRVLRSSHQAYCYVFADSKGKGVLERLRAIKTARNGFELAEFDLALRGPGQLSGGAQWGVSDIAMEALKNLKMVEAARTEAKTLIEKDPALGRHPEIAGRVQEISKVLHFE